MPSPNPHDKVKNTWKRDWARNKTVYLVFVPVAIYIIVTHYLPMFGIVMAFQDFSLSKGVFGSTFVGPDNFVELFTGDAFLNAFKNTAIMAAFSLVLGFFPGLIFALMLSEVRNKTFKRTIQMISYLPNFVAAVVVTNLVKLFLGNDGPLTALLTALGLPQQNWLANANPPVFWLIHTFMGIWQSLGFGSILLMSAIANINGDIVEAAAIDGATRMQRILRITIPCIAPILGMSFVLNIAISFRTIGGNVLLLYTANLLRSRLSVHLHPPHGFRFLSRYGPVCRQQPVPVRAGHRAAHRRQCAGREDQPRLAVVLKEEETCRSERKSAFARAWWSI